MSLLEREINSDTELDASKLKELFEDVDPVRQGSEYRRIILSEIEYNKWVRLQRIAAAIPEVLQAGEDAFKESNDYSYQLDLASLHRLGGAIIIYSSFWKPQAGEVSNIIEEQPTKAEAAFLGRKTIEAMARSEGAKVGDIFNYYDETKKQTPGFISSGSEPDIVPNIYTPQGVEQLVEAIQIQQHGEA